MPDLPPMDPATDEASAAQLDRAREQGNAYGSAFRMMTDEVADDGGEQRAGDYLVGYAIEEAEGLYRMEDGDLVWEEPDAENVHIEITVRDAADGRFIPGLDVEVTLTDPSGNEVGTRHHDLVWHPMIYHYARNWTVPSDGSYRMEVSFDPPAFPRHDRTNGRRFVAPATVRFDDVRIEI